MQLPFLRRFSFGKDLQMRKLAFAILLMAMSCTRGFSENELELIHGSGETMRVLTIENKEDLDVLRTKSCDFPMPAFESEDYKKLCSLMVATVTSPEQDGVGIAGPQVGLNRRVVAVQRFDKEGEPFEVYGNIRITEFLGEKTLGPEGCLSVPDRREDVDRYQDIIIEYAHEGKLVTERVSGFTAVIFQHEVDHLEGILYIDRVDK
jgi:peptide deformylase